MAKLPQEDLFEPTSMTFGEHLEELRVSMLRALLGMAIGMAIGFFIADQVVMWIEHPLLKALDKHHTITAKLRLEKVYPKGVPAEMVQLATDRGFIFEDVYFEWEELAWLSGQLTKAGKDLPPDARDRRLPAPSANLVKTRIWKESEAKLTTLSPHESFMIWLKAAAVTGLLIASPYMFYEIWSFVAAGLYPHEKRYVYIFLPFSLVLFLAGAALAFFFVFGPVLEFLFSFSRWMNIDPDLRISEVISFVLVLPLGFGVAFQLPLVMLFMNRIGIMTTQAYLEKWRIAILAIFVLSMLLTPADPVSMLLMAVPLTVLYFLGIALCQWMPKGRNPFAEAFDPE